MLRAIVIVVIVIGLAVGGLMILRSSARTGVPGEDVLRRARQRELDLEKSESQDKED